MQVWMVMIGAQLLTFAIAFVMVVVWMRKPRDRYDELLEKTEQPEKAKKG